MKSRFSLYVLIIALSVLAFCALGVWFLICDAPRLVAAGKGAVTREYRVVAEAMTTNCVVGVRPVVRTNGWRQISRIANQTPWGVVEQEDGKVLIWIQREDRSLVGVEREAKVDRTAWWIYGGFGFAMLFVISVAAFGIVLLIRYNRERELFLAGMVHDLVNPLVAIRGLAASDPVYAAGLAESMLRMVRNAQAFLGLGRRRGGKCGRFDLVPVIRESYRIFESSFAEDESGPVAFDLPETLTVTGDQSEVRQILWNLFSNAVKYAAPYGPVKVSAFDRGGFAAVEFADHGIGMTPRQMRRAFGRFYRAAGLHECGKGGFGIGLYTSRIAARRMGGDLTVRSNAPRGCVFSLILKRLEIRE